MLFLMLSEEEKKEMENWCVMDLNIIGSLTINREK